MFDKASLKLGLDKAVLQSMGGDKAVNPVRTNLFLFCGCIKSFELLNFLCNRSMFNFSSQLR